MCRFKNYLITCIFVLGALFWSRDTYGQYPIQVMTSVMQPVPPYLPQIRADMMGNRSGQLNQDVSSHISISLSNRGTAQSHIKLAGSIERISPSPMGVSLRSDYQPSHPIVMNPQQMLQLDQATLQNAFGNFSKNALVYSNISLATLQQNGVDFKLPEGTYRVCVTAYDYDKAGFSDPLSMPGSGCAYFTVCYTASAPQLIAPVSTQLQFVTGAANMALLRQAKPDGSDLAQLKGNGGFQTYMPLSSQIQFTWTPPATTCGIPVGALTYDLEIRQVFDGQTLTDAISNPFVFRQQNIHTTTFLLDTLRYPHVLVGGRKYIVRVKANFMAMPGSPLEIANQGYSQIGGFDYESPAPMVTYSHTGNVNSSVSGQSGTPKADSVSGPKAAPIGLGACLATSSPVTNKTNLKGGSGLKGKNVKIGDFVMHLDSIAMYTDSSYQGAGYITWSPLGHALKIKVRFDSIRINMDTVVYKGGVVTSTDHSLPKWDQVTATGNVDTTGLHNADYQQLETYVTSPTHLINELNGTDEIAFPVGLNHENSGSDLISNTTLAIMGITFTPAGTSMNVLFNLNIPEANGWLSMAGTCFQITPGGFSFTNGLLYLPGDRLMTWDGMSFTFKGCNYNKTNNTVDTTRGTYLQWNKDGIQDIVAKADLTLDTSAIVPVDNNDKRMAGVADTIHLRFHFTDWNHWMADITPSQQFEITSLPGFPISVSGGFVYDHNISQDPAGIQFPAEYTDHPKQGAFEGLYIKDLSMGIPPDFKSFAGDKPRFGFSNFMINGDGLTTKIYARDILSLQTGDLGGWAFSIDTFQVGFVKSNPLTEGFKMVGKVKVPISDSDALQYTCRLNAGTATTGGGISYLFNIHLADTLNVNLWKAKLTLNPNSNFTIQKDSLGMAIGTTLNGSIGIESKSPKISLTALSFQGLYVGNRDTTGGVHKEGFNFSAGHWSLGSASASSGKKSSKTAFAYPVDLPYYHPLLAGGPLPPANMGYYAAAADSSSSGSSQSKASGFSINLSNFTPSFNVVNTREYEAGITFNVSVNIGSGDKSIISGTSKIGVFGKIDVPANQSPKVSFDRVQLDSVGLHGAVGPVTVDGSLTFLHDDSEFGDGVNGTLQATLPIATLAAGARFGTVHGYHYWAVAGSVYMQSGIQIGPVVFNGFGGGVAYNMEIGDVDPDKISQPNTILPQVPLTPQEGNYVFTAQVFLALFRPQTLNANLALSAGISSSGGLQEISLDGAGYVFSDNPPSSNPKAIVSVEPMHMDYNFPDGTFDADIVGHLHFNKVTARVPIWIHVDKQQQYFYVGRPDKGNNGKAAIHILTIGKPTDALYANLDASAYLDAGNTLPAFPGLPDVIKRHQLQNGTTPHVNTGTVEQMLRQMGAAGNPGFMFGAEVNGQLNLSFSFLYAKGAATLGFDLALEQVKPDEIPPGCQQTDGTFGFNNWYAIGQLYAYLGIDVGAHVNTSFYKGDFSLMSLDADAILQGGLPNPSWMLGQVHIKASILGGVVSVDDDYPVAVGNQCTVHVNPLDEQQLITKAGPASDAGVFDKPYAVFSLPMDGRIFPITVPPDNDHHQPYTRNFHFLVDQFKLVKVTSGGDSLLSGRQDMDAGGESVTLYRNDMLDPHSQYKVYIRCKAQELLNGSWGDPVEGPVEQDTTLLFTTGDAPAVIAPQNIVYTYPIDGQQYLLKNEFGGQGEIKLGNWQSNLFPAPDPSRGIASYKYELKFVPESGGQTVTTTFTKNEGAKTLTFNIPGSLQNSTIYRMEMRVIPVWQHVNGVPAYNNLNIQHVQHVNTQSRSVTTLQKDANGNLVQSQVTQQMTVNVSAQSVTGTPQVIPTDPDPIYILRFRTSQFNTFADKMASYGSLQETIVPYPANKSLIKGNAPGVEGFDEFELNGYTSQCTTSETGSGLQFAPMFHAVIPYDPTHTSDQDYFNNIYTPLHTLSVLTASTGQPEFQVSLGAQEKRNYLNWNYPEYTVTNAMPYAARLGPPAPVAGATDGNDGSSQSQPAHQQPVYMSKLDELGLDRPTVMKATPARQYSYGGGIAANHQDGHQSSPYASPAQGSSQPAPDPRTISLVWNRYAYVSTDLSLAKSFAAGLLSGMVSLPNSAGRAYPAYSQGHVLGQGEYGTILINPHYTGPVMSGDPAVNIANHFSGYVLHGWGDAGNRNIKFTYQKPWCALCGSPTVTRHIQ